MDNGWFDQDAIDAERFDADMEMAQLNAAGNRYARAASKAKRLYQAGDLAGAAQACKHGWIYPLASEAARHESDPRVGESGVRCIHCGSVLSAHPAYDGPVTILHPCEHRPFQR